MTTATRSTVLTLAGLGLVALAGCGTQVSGTTGAADASFPTASASDPPSGSPAVPTGLTCPTDLRVGTSGGSFAPTEMPQGWPSRRELVAATTSSERPVVLAGDSAYVLRPDGTAFEQMYIVKGDDGFFFHGYEACDGES